MSCDGVRKCRPAQVELINGIWDQIKPHMISNAKGDNLKQLSWCNFYQNQKFKVDFPLKEQCIKWLEELVEEIYPNNHILFAGFVRNPAHSRTNQPWHLDYEQTNIIMIPLVDQATETATQIIETPLNQEAEISPLGYKSHYGSNTLEILDKEGLDFMKVTQVVCRSHTIIKVNSGTAHRGIANVSDQERVLFTLNCSPKLITLKEEPINVTNFKGQTNK